MTDAPEQPLESPTIGHVIVAFHSALHALGAAQKEWERRQSEQTASAIESAAGAVESALGMMVLVVPQGLGQTLSEVDAWRARRRLFMPVSPVSGEES